MNLSDILNNLQEGEQVTFNQTKHGLELNVKVGSWEAKSLEDRGGIMKPRTLAERLYDCLLQLRDCEDETR